MNDEWNPVKITEETLRILKEKKKKLKGKKYKQEIEFWKQEIKEIDGEVWISVKGTAKAYGVNSQTIHYHIKQNPNIFDNHLDLQKYYMDKFAFYNIGTLLRRPPTINPISKWQTQIKTQEFRDTVISAIKPCKKVLKRYKKTDKKIKRKRKRIQYIRKIYTKK